MADPITIQPNLADAVSAAMAYVGQAKALVVQAQTAVTAASGIANTILTNHIYGQFTVDPSVRPDGTAMQDGDLYYNLSLRVLRMRANGVWTTVAISAGAGTLLASANLSDLSDKTAARAALLLGSAAVLNAGTVNGVATLDSNGFIPVGQLNLSVNGALIKTNNLSDLVSPSTARTNLGLGNAATATIGTGVPSLVAGTVPIAQLPGGIALGVATLDASGHVSLAQMNAGNANGVATLTAGGLLTPSQNPAGSPTTVAKSADYTTVTGDSGKIIAVTTGSSTDKTITLVSAATAGDGATMIVQKVDSGTKKVIVTGGTASAWLSNQGDIIAYRSDGTIWQPYWINITPRVETFNTGSSTWTKAPLAAHVLVQMWGSGGGGQAGSASSSDISGGKGGGGGAFWQKEYSASELASTENVTVGAGGVANGGSGGDTTFGTIVKILIGGGNGGGGGGGGGGGVFRAIAVSGVFTVGGEGALGFVSTPGDGMPGIFGGASGGNIGSPSLSSGKGGSSGFGGGGGGSGGVGNTATAGAAGGATGSIVAGGGAAGGAPGNNAGTAGPSRGVGGGGGGGNTGATQAGVGGVGGIGAGGGGGGSSGLSGTGGAGAAGGPGQAVITTMFSI